MSPNDPVSGPETRRFERWLGIQTSAKAKTYGQIAATTEIARLSYWLEIFFSAGIATFGLVENSPAVIIGAMLISPLMGPIMATGLALAAGDLYLGVRSVLNLLASVAVSITFAGFLVWLLPFHSATAEILARTNPNLLDLGIALFSGLAGSVVLCRGGGDGATALPGVAIAVALMPPLCAMGFGLGSGINLTIMGGAGLLFLTNLVAIVASAFLVFLSLGMSRARTESVSLSSSGRIASLLAAGGHLRWRVLMIVILLASISVPLRRALLQVANETLTRGLVENQLKTLVDANAIVSQQVTVGDDAIEIHLISTKPVAEAIVNKTRQDLIRRTGRDVQISVDAVASDSQLANLMERLSQRAPAIPKAPTFAETQRDLLDKVRSAITLIWPSSDAPIRDFNVSTGDAGTVISIHYQAARDLGDVPVAMVQKSLQTQLDIPDLTVTAERVNAPPPPVLSHSKPRHSKP